MVFSRVLKTSLRRSSANPSLLPVSSERAKDLGDSESVGTDDWPKSLQHTAQ